MNIIGRSAEGNPANRFAALRVEADEDAWRDDDARPLRTEILRDDSQSVLGRVDSEDLAFEYGLNPYRGCEHGCAYCYARTYHEYLGFSAGLDFESKIVAKENAPELLERELAAPRYRPGEIAMSGVTDCYQPVEKQLEITRGCLGVLARFRNPVVVITKNSLIERDIDHLQELARHHAVAVYVSVTTLDRGLAGKLEPRASSPRSRLGTIRRLNEAGIPAGVSAAPIIPGLNDAELPAILAACADHGAGFAMYSMVRLPGAVAEVFSRWLDRNHPLAKEKILGRIRDAHGGRLNGPPAPGGRRMKGAGEGAGQLRALFHAACRKNGISPGRPELNLAAFRKLMPRQGELF